MIQEEPGNIWNSIVWNGDVPAMWIVFELEPLLADVLMHRFRMGGHTRGWTNQLLVQPVCGRASNQTQPDQYAQSHSPHRHGSVPAAHRQAAEGLILAVIRVK